jgi:hypothetical protein
MALSNKNLFSRFRTFIFLLTILSGRINAQEIDCDMETAVPPKDYHYCSTYLGHIMDFTNGFITFKTPQDFGDNFCDPNGLISGYYMLKPDTDEDCLTYLKNHLNDCPQSYQCFDWSWPGNGYFGSIIGKISDASFDASPKQYCDAAPTFQSPVSVADDNGSDYLNLNLKQDNSIAFVETLDDAWDNPDLTNSIYFRAVQINSSLGLNDAAIITFSSSTVVTGEGTPEPNPNPGSIFEWDMIINTTNGGHELYDVYNPPVTTQVRFQRTVTHELCHIIGLGHVVDPALDDPLVPLMVKPVQTTDVFDATVASSACVKRGIECLYGCTGTGIGCIDAKTCDGGGDTGLPLTFESSIDSENNRTLTWIVQDETEVANTLGFNVYKKEKKSGDFKSINTELIKLELGIAKYSITIKECNRLLTDEDTEYYLEFISYPSDRLVLLYPQKEDRIEINSTISKQSGIKDGY